MPTLLEHRDLGETAGRPLVLLTGFGASIGHWPPPLVSALATGRRVLLVQNPGVGASSPEGADGCAATAARVADLLDALAAGRCDVVGWSMGGMVAQALAVARPDLVGALVLAATAPGTGTAAAPDPGTLTALASGDPARMLDVLFPGDPDAADAYRAAIAEPPGPTPVPPRVLAAQGAATRAWRHGTDPAGPRTATITAPILVVQGDRDALCPPVNADRLAGTLAAAARWRRPGAGHGVLFPDPAGTAETLLRFLDDPDRWSAGDPGRAG